MEETGSSPPAPALTGGRLSSPPPMCNNHTPQQQQAAAVPASFRLHAPHCPRPGSLVWLQPSWLRLRAPSMPAYSRSLPNCLGVMMLLLSTAPLSSSSTPMRILPSWLTLPNRSCQALCCSTCPTCTAWHRPFSCQLLPLLSNQYRPRASPCLQTAPPALSPLPQRRRTLPSQPLTGCAISPTRRRSWSTNLHLTSPTN